MNFIKTSFAFTFLVMLLSCENNSPADLEDSTVADVVTYKNTVKAIIDTNCISCHGTVPTNGAPMSLATYADVKASVLNLGTIDRIMRQSGDPLKMPLGPTRLPQARIDAVVKWQTQGLQE
jgi:mono/diheme cytochrome c family protein